ncbi:TDT family transporter [Vibrio sp. SM6]|uniref:TDT family transporter n=1 Tax=Vibrio agarilyticus TaxID=2726741 RepID=A0A7X8TS57_9VIBR|nr:TDT family transporter [Vibrio agarilyticus]NLS13815.1 TDT family transporter [Vibrio agarilyticus]
MNLACHWKALSKLQSIPTSQAALALGLIGLGQAWALYAPSFGDIIRPSLVLIGALLLSPVLLKYALYPRLFINDLRHPLNGSLMAPMSMALLVLCDYLASAGLWFAYPVWALALTLHITMMVLFLWFQLRRFRMVNIVPAWFLYPVGLISSSLAGSQLGHNIFAQNVALVCISIYFFMLPVVLYRLVFFGSLPRRARPTLAIMAAPINLTLAAYLVNFPNPDPILTGALAGIAITMTLLIYLCYLRLLRLKFQPSIAAVTFPSVISAIAMYKLTDYFDRAYPQWQWLHDFGFFELSVATVLVIWVAAGYSKMYFNRLLSRSH